MILAVLTLTVAQLLDLGTFVRMVSEHGPAVEANPLVAGLLEDLGLPFVAVAKITALSVVVAVVAVLSGSEARPRRPRMAAFVVGFAILAGLFGGWTNASVIVSA